LWAASISSYLKAALNPFLYRKFLIMFTRVIMGEENRQQSIKIGSNPFSRINRFRFQIQNEVYFIKLIQIVKRIDNFRNNLI